MDNEIKEQESVHHQAPIAKQVSNLVEKKKHHHKKHHHSAK
jgi:hypothetical protein